MSESQERKEAQALRVIEERIDALPAPRQDPLPDLAPYREEVIKEALAERQDNEQNKQSAEPNP